MELKIKSLCAEIEIKKDDEKNYASMVVTEKFADVETVINVILNKKDIFELCDFFQTMTSDIVGISLKKTIFISHKKQGKGYSTGKPITLEFFKKALRDLEKK